MGEWLGEVCGYVRVCVVMCGYVWACVGMCVCVGV